jgi:hypothetical protein
MVDMYTYNIEYVGARSTGWKASKYLIAGPGWDGPTPSMVYVAPMSAMSSSPDMQPVREQRMLLSSTLCKTSTQ